MMSNHSEVFRVGITSTDAPNIMECAFKEMTSVKTTTCQHPGMDVENLRMLLDYMNVAMKLVDMDSAGFLEYVDGNWTGYLGAIYYGQIDTMGFGYSRTDLRSQSFAYSYPTLQSDTYFAARKREASFLETSMTLFKAFDWRLWLLLVVFFILQAICLFAVRFALKGVLKRQLAADVDEVDGSAAMTWEWFRFWIGQDWESRQKSYTGNVLLFIFAIQVVIMIGLYQGAMLTKLLKPPLTDPFRTADEFLALIESGKDQIVTNYPDLWYFEEARLAETDYFRRVQAALADNPIITVSNTTEMFDMIIKGGYVTVFDGDGASYDQATKICDLALISEGMPKRYRQYLLRKDSPFLNRINQASVAKMVYQQHLYEEYFLNTAVDRANACDKSVTIIKPISLSTLVGLMCLFLSGMLIGCIAVLIERFFAFWNSWFKPHSQTIRNPEPRYIFHTYEK